MIEIINKLKAEYDTNRHGFEFTASIYLAGDGKKSLRQQLMEYLTGHRTPASKCKYHAVVKALKINFDQPTLF